MACRMLICSLCHVCRLAICMLEHRHEYMDPHTSRSQTTTDLPAWISPPSLNIVLSKIKKDQIQEGVASTEFCSPLLVFYQIHTTESVFLRLRVDVHNYWNKHPAHTTLNDPMLPRPHLTLCNLSNANVRTWLRFN